jgi:hypothetical protein
MMAEGMQPYALAAPLMIAILCELIGWVVDVQVLVRKAPKWFAYINLIKSGVQSVCLVCAVMFLPLSNDAIIPMMATAAANVYVVVSTRPP